jgi:hypothetical protein
VVCDCEGAERDVLRPDVAGALARADLLVEVHDNVDPSLSRLLRARFESTHEIRAVHPAPRRARDCPAARFLGPRARHYAVVEPRAAGCHWLHMTARSA